MSIRKTRLSFLCMMLAVCMTLTSCIDLGGLISTVGSSAVVDIPVSTPEGDIVSSPNSEEEPMIGSSPKESKPQPPIASSSEAEPETPLESEFETTPVSAPESSEETVGGTEPETETTPAQCEHEYAVSEVHPNTCTVDGYTVYHCIMCGEIKTGDVVTAPGHSYGEWETVTEPQIGIGGLDKRICGVCQHEMTRETSVGQPITHRLGNSSYGYYSFSKYEHGEEMQELYRSLLASCEKFMTSTEKVSMDEGVYVIDYIDIREYKMSMEEMASVWKIFVQECPRYYWLGNTIQIQKGKLYLIIDELYADPAHRQACDAAIEEMTAEAVALVNPSDSQLERAIKMHDYLADRLTYAYIEGTMTPETARWAHNLEGAALRGLGVCETYAKSFMYLCAVNGVECLFVSGNANGPHAWNYVKLEGGWYAVDLTWDDGSGKYLKYSNFGLSYKSISEDHTHDTPNSFGLNYLYELPTLEEKDLQPVVLYKEDMLIDTYASPEAAFSAMTDGENEYTLVMLLNDTEVYAESLPAVERITFVGLNEQLSENSFYGSSTLMFKAGVTLYCHVTFENVNVTGSIDLGAYTLTTEGLYCSLEGSINGGDESEGIKVNTTYLTEITAIVTVKIEVLQGYCDEKKQ